MNLMKNVVTATALPSECQLEILLIHKTFAFHEGLIDFSNSAKLPYLICYHGIF